MLKQLLSVFLESRCPCCQRTTPTTVCKYCLKKLSSHQLSQSDRLKLYRELSVFAWGKYDGQLKRAIATMKYNNQPELGTLLGKLLGEAWVNSEQIKSLPKITVVPIPLHRQKLKARGFNQAETIAKSFCRVTGSTLQSQALIRMKQTKAMFDLKDLTQRAKNIQGAFRIGNKLPKHPVLLIDDIYTTGTTVQESARVLQQAKIKVVGVAVVAKAGK
ncbi:ComF family protein [Pleurocapsales cyanobacterium LEGE 10410]|nr:ComF family protein [Pleurocapsales cyanobacterium LEGE 10410]